MNIIKTCAFIVVAIVLLACTTSGPRKTLDELASALQNNRPGEFLSLVDMEAYADNSLAALTSGNAVYSSLNSLSSMLGLGGLDAMINSVIDYRAEVRDRLAKEVASGELVLRCEKSGETNCPWVPVSLRNALIIEIEPSAAIAKVTTPQKLTSWIALRKIGEKWLVTGQSLLEEEARKYALTPGKNAEPDAKSI